MTDEERGEQAIVLARLRRHAAILAGAFGLALLSIEAERPQVKRRYGICYTDGSIRIRLRSVRTGELLKYSSMVDTLCHELAHLKHFNHGRRFWVFYERIRGYALRHGIYRPGPEAPTIPTAPAIRPSESTPPVRLRSAQPPRPPGRRGQAPVRPEPPAQLDLF